MKMRPGRVVQIFTVLPIVLFAIAVNRIDLHHTRYPLSVAVAYLIIAFLGPLQVALLFHASATTARRVTLHILLALPLVGLALLFMYAPNTGLFQIGVIWMFILMCVTVPFGGFGSHGKKADRDGPTNEYSSAPSEDTLRPPR